MPEVLLVNPKRRRRKTSTATRRRKTSTTRRTTPAPPKPKRRARTTRTITTFRANPIRKRRSMRANPIRLRLPKGLVKGQLIPALHGAAGALLVDAIIGNVPGIPAGLKTGPVRHATKAVTAIILGMGAEHLVKKDTARTAAIGALTVTGYNALKELLAKFAPQFQLGYYEDVAAGIGNAGRLGYWSPGQVTGYREADQLGYYPDPGMFDQPDPTMCECPPEVMQ